MKPLAKPGIPPEKSAPPVPKHATNLSAPLFRLPESGEKTKRDIHSHFTEKYHWEPEESSDIIDENKRIDAYSGKTLG
jgi:hypothetical protein